MAPSPESDAAPAESTKIMWGRVQARLRSAYNYWLGTATPDGTPHVVPVWGIWMENIFIFGTDRHSRKGRNLAANPRVVVHLESGDDVVILTGNVAEITDAALLHRMDAVYAAKYVDGVTGQPYHPLVAEAAGNAAVFYAMHPTVAHAWLEAAFVLSANRWDFRDNR